MRYQDQNNKIEVIKGWLGSGSINIFGVPFAGKDTQATAVAKLLDAQVIGGGDLLRSHSDQEKIRELMLTGELFPTDFYLEIILPFLSKPEFSGKPLVLSSIGRWHGEEKVVMQAAEQAGHPIKAVVNITIDDNLVHQRFEASQTKNDRGKRHDDALHLIDVRLTEFKQKTLPVIEAYRQAGLLVTVDGNQSPENVCNEIINSLFTKASGEK